MDKYKFIILGAGPAGLTFANSLLDNGENSFIVLEKENEAGGLCRSALVDGSPLDIGGGHFLDIKNKVATEYIFRFLPKIEWNKFDRKSTIKINNEEIDYPFESNIWQLSVDMQVKYLISIFKAGCNSGAKKPNKFIDWIYWKLGDEIANNYMLPYNEKVWSIDLNKLGTYWLYKLPNVSSRESLMSCLNKTPYGKLPAHAKFYYPKKYGYGEIWARMAKRIKNHLIYNTRVESIDLSNRTINNKFFGEKIIVTIPWTNLNFNKQIPEDIVKKISLLEYSSIRVTYYPNNIASKAHWTYFPDKNVPEHRRLYRFNFIENSKGYWTETNEKRSFLISQKKGKFWVNKFAYPLNTLSKPSAIKSIINYFLEKNIYGLGRWGEWEHMNSDIVVAKSLELSKKLLNN